VSDFEDASLSAWHIFPLSGAATTVEAIISGTESKNGAKSLLLRTPTPLSSNAVALRMNNSKATSYTGAFKGYPFADFAGKTKLTFWMKAKTTGNPAGMAICFGNGGDPSTVAAVVMTDFTKTAYTTADYASGTSFSYTAASLQDQPWTEYSIDLKMSGAGFLIPAELELFVIRLGRTSGTLHTGWEIYFDDFKLL
jgi:hypothetical protein